MSMASTVQHWEFQLVREARAAHEQGVVVQVRQAVRFDAVHALIEDQTESGSSPGRMTRSVCVDRRIGTTQKVHQVPNPGMPK